VLPALLPVLPVQLQVLQVPWWPVANKIWAMSASESGLPPKAISIFLCLFLSACQLPGSPLQPPAVANGRILYAANSSGSYQIWLQDLANLTQAALPASCPAASICSEARFDAQQQHVLLIARQGQNNYHLLLFDLTSQTTQTLHQSEVPLQAPTSHPEGTSIALQQGAPGAEQIVLLQAGQVQVIGPGRYPQWAPDGQSLAFIRQQRIYTYTPAQANSQPLTPAGERDFYPRWSPDGKHLAYLTQTEDTWQLALMQADGRARQILLPGQAALTPEWSPDGQTLAYVTPGRFDNPADSAPQQDPAHEIRTLNIHAPQESQLISRGNGHSRPLWTQDGQWLVFQSSQSGKVQLYLIRSDGQKMQPISQTSANHLLNDVS